MKKNRTWIIIVIMAIALTISIAYSAVVSYKNKNKDQTVTTTSIIEMTATTATIKNTLTGIGVIEYKNIADSETTNTNNAESDTENVSNENQEDTKLYQITLSVEDKNLSKVTKDEKVEIIAKKEDNSFNYSGKVIKISEDSNNKSTIDIQIINPDSNITEGMSAVCNIIVEKAENVVALPVEAIQYMENGDTYVDVVQDDESTQSVIVKTGLSDNSYVEITSGLKVGDRVQIIKSTTTTVVDDNKN